jgi:hypothetical protein
VRNRLHGRNGITFRQDGPWTDGIERHASAAAAAQRLGDRLSEAGALNDLGVVRLMTGEYTNAIEAPESALSIASDIGDRLAQLNANNYLGDVRRWTGDPTARWKRWRRPCTSLSSSATARVRPVGSSRSAPCDAWAGDFPGAFEAGQMALRMYRDLGNRHGQAESLNYLGCCAGDRRSRRRGGRPVDRAGHLS